jgi:hypothetical protein
MLLFHTETAAYHKKATKRSIAVGKLPCFLFRSILRYHFSHVQTYKSKIHHLWCSRLIQHFNVKLPNFIEFTREFCWLGILWNGISAAEETSYPVVSLDTSTLVTGALGFQGLIFEDRRLLYSSDDLFWCVLMRKRQNSRRKVGPLI